MAWKEWFPLSNNRHLRPVRCRYIKQTIMYQNYNKKIGFHFHDNVGTAYSNYIFCLINLIQIKVEL